MIRSLLILLFTFFTTLSIAALPEFTPGLQDRQTTTDSSGQDLMVYPNPAQSGKVTLELKSGEIAEVRLINILGKEVVSRSIDNGTIKYVLSLDNLPDGIYFVRVKSADNITVVKKLVVSNM